MRFALAALALLTAVSTAAATPEDDYIAARDKAAAAVKQLEDSKAKDALISAADNKALADLQKRLVALIGPVAVKGFPKTAKINLETLGSGLGANKLDGLAFSTPSTTSATPLLVVSTQKLLARWLKTRAADPDRAPALPSEAAAAFAADVFYTETIGSDAAFSKASAINIAKPAGTDLALAALGRWSQDIGPSPLTDIIVVVVKGERVLIADVAAGAKIPALPACEALWTTAQKKARAFDEAYQATGGKDETLTARGQKATEQGDRDWLACLAAQIKAQPFYPALRAEAQNLAERLAAP